jgi:hypothetical protein
MREAWTDEVEALRLRERIRVLEEENEVLKKKLDLTRGVPAEIFVADLTEGNRTRYKDRHDVTDMVGRASTFGRRFTNYVAASSNANRRSTTSVITQSSAVQPSEPALPGHPVFRLQQDSNFNIEIREALLQFAHELPDGAVSLDLPISTVSDVVLREELIGCIPLPFDKENLICGFDLRRD